MQITGLKVFLVNPGQRVSFGTGNGKNWIFVKLYTDAGIDGVGEAVGDGIDICLDYHGRSFSPAEALPVVQALEPFHLLFIEEPTLWDNVDSLVELKAKTSVPIAAGEKIVGRSQWRELIQKRAVDVIQPDPQVCVGILETVKIAAMAEAYHVQLAPHNACGPVSIAACANIAACVPNFLIQEYGVEDSECARAIVPEPLRLMGGYLELPQQPGLGVTFDEEAAARFPYRPFDRPVVLDARDGSIGLE